jgi:hypothetical protein
VSRLASQGGSDRVNRQTWRDLVVRQPTLRDIVASATALQDRLIVTALERRYSYRVIGNLFGVSKSHVCNIISKCKLHSDSSNSCPE